MCTKTFKDVINAFKLFELMVEEENLLNLKIYLNINNVFIGMI